MTNVMSPRLRATYSLAHDPTLGERTPRAACNAQCYDDDDDDDDDYYYYCFIPIAAGRSAWRSHDRQCICAGASRAL